LSEMTMYQPDDYFRKKKRPYLLPTLLIALLLGVYLGGDMAGWWGGTPTQTRQMIEADRLADPAGPAANQSITNVPEYPTVTPYPTPVTEIMAPDFALPDLYDEEILYILSRYEGRPVILNFWASWCGPCRVEMPAFQAAFEQYEDDGLVILAVNQTFIDNAEAAREFADEMGLTFPLARDDDGRVSEGLYQVRGLPTTVVIRPDGTVAFVQIGPLNDTQIAEVGRRLAVGEMIP
jgi:cytochrome c biogenesis protein CcmG/thiol:disulfide interchange protein DsbE